MAKHQHLLSESILWSIIDRLPIAIYIKDPECKFTYANLQCAKNLHAKHPHEVLGKTDEDFFDINQAKDWIEHEKRIMSLNEDMIDRKELEVWPDGKRNWVLTSKLPVVAPDGTVLGLFGMTKDITEWERINLAVAGAREGLWYRAIDSEEVWYSPRWKEILGYSDHEIKNRREEFKKRVHPDDWSHVKEKCDDHFYHGAKDYECIFRMRHKDGRDRWIRSRGKLSRDENNNPMVFAGSHADITDSRDWESFYLKVLDTIPSMIFVKDKELKFVFVNEALAKNFGLRKDEIIGKMDKDINEDREQVARFVKDDMYVITNEKPKEIPEEVLTDSEGNERTLTTIKLPLVYPGTTETHMLGVATDITDLKKTREDLRKILSVLTDAVKDIEDSANEESACESVLLQLDRIGYQSVMLSFLREVNGRRAIVADPRYTTGKFEIIANRIHRPFDVQEAESDLLPAVLARGQSRFIPDSANDRECDGTMSSECGVVSQYVVPILTESLMIGTIQIDLGSQKERPETTCGMFDALGAHLSLAIERHRSLTQLDELNARLRGQAGFIAFNLAATRVTHELNHSVSDYLIKLRQAKRNSEIRTNKASMDFLKETNKFVERWYNSLNQQMRVIEATDKPGLHSLSDIAKEAIEDWLPRATRRKCRLFGEYDVQCGKVSGRRGELKEMLACLINNGIEANSRKVIIRIKRFTQIRPMLPPKNYAVVEVADDGDGVAPRYREKIFEFGWTSKRKGHGVGLAVVQVLAEVMGGKLEINSLGKSGGQKETRFSLKLPVAGN